MKRILVALVALLVLASTASAQSLADLAKKEEERRRALKEPAKVLTNEDLKKFGGTQPTQPAKGDAAPPATAAADAKPGAAKPDAAKTDAAKTDASNADAAKSDSDKKGQEPVKDESWWRNRITTARAALERNRLTADALQSRINQLWADFTSRDDPIQKRALGDERVRVIAELERLKKEMEDQKQGIADIETEARRAGVPPGWLR